MKPQPKQCAWCNRWYDARGQIVRRPFFLREVSHGICPDCYLTKIEEIKAMRKATECTTQS